MHFRLPLVLLLTTAACGGTLGPEYSEVSVVDAALDQALDSADFGSNACRDQIKIDFLADLEAQGIAVVDLSLSQAIDLLLIFLESYECGTPDPDPAPGPVPGPDTTALFPIDRGDEGASTPGSYKGLPLRLTRRGSANVTAVDGKIGVLCIGMSNSNLECQRYLQDIAAGAAAEINPQVTVINCAVGGYAIEKWNRPSLDATTWDACINQKIPAAGLQPSQVRVLYHKAAIQFSSPDNYPLPDSNYERFYNELGAFAARAKTAFPSLQAVYTTSRGQGYFSGSASRGEPNSYEQGHALNGFLADATDANGMLDGVYHTWGPYIWAGECGIGLDNAAGYCYVRGDFNDDGVHPIEGGNRKIAEQIHRRFLQEAWYANGTPDPGPIPDPDPPPSDDTKRWNPGHYLRLQGAFAQSNQAAYFAGIHQQLNSKLDAIPELKGALVAVAWGRFNPTGNTYHWDDIDTLLDAVTSRGKRLILMPSYKSFTGSPAAYEVPADLLHQVDQTNSGWWGGVHRPATMSRFITALEALAARYDDNPNLEMILTQESAPSFGGGFEPADYDKRAYAGELKRLYAAAASAFRRTNVAPSMNSLNGELPELMEAAYQLRIGIAAPDARPVPAWQLFEGGSTNGEAAVRDYRRTIPRPATISTSALQVQTPAETIDLMQVQAVTHAMWIPSISWDAVLSAIVFDPSVHTDCPTRYIACEM